MLRTLALSLICICGTLKIAAQEILPKFSAVLEPNGKILISWRNKYPVVNQISIQRSFDSLKNFTTLLTVQNPSVPANGFVDAKAPNARMFYRLFIVLDSGKYVFAKSRRPAPDTASVTGREREDHEALSRSESQRLTYIQRNEDSLAVNGPDKIREAPVVKLDKLYFIKRADTLVGQLFERNIHKFKDSVLSKTKDTLVFKGTDTILIRPFVPKEVYKISAYVFTSRDGNVTVSVPETDQKKYTVRFLELDGAELFQVREIKQSPFTVDKTNFFHAGWIRFELYEDGKLKEKNKLFIPKEF